MILIDNASREALSFVEADVPVADARDFEETDDPNVICEVEISLGSNRGAEVIVIRKDKTISQTVKELGEKHGLGEKEGKAYFVLLREAGFRMHAGVAPRSGTHRALQRRVR